MSRYHRKHDLWPADRFAVHVWHLVAALEDITDLVEASKIVDSLEVKTTLMKKVLVEVKSFDALVAEFQATLRRDAAARELSTTQQGRLKAALETYHRAVQPLRERLADIRNTLAGHRHALPDERQRERFGKDFSAWGEWEQHLVSLEQECTLERWVNVINAAITLRNVVVDTSPGSWFSIAADGGRLFLPLRMEPGEV